MTKEIFRIVYRVSYSDLFVMGFRLMVSDKENFLEFFGGLVGTNISL